MTSPEPDVITQHTQLLQRGLRTGRFLVCTYQGQGQPRGFSTPSRQAVHVSMSLTRPNQRIINSFFTPSDSCPPTSPLRVQNQNGSLRGTVYNIVYNSVYNIVYNIVYDTVYNTAPETWQNGKKSTCQRIQEL